jgi:hypothetical protein
MRAAEDHGKGAGDALLKYKPQDAEYRRILEHIGGLKPGETKPVPPWPPGEPGKSPRSPTASVFAVSRVDV